MAYIGQSVIGVEHPATSALNATTGTFSGNVNVTGTVAATALTGNGSGITNLSGTGKVLQVVENTFASQVTTSSTSFVTLGSVEASITPSSTSSKIFISFNTSVYTNSTADSCFITLYRGTVASGTNLGAGTDGLGRAWSSAGQTVQNLTFLLVDEPSTTSAQTYQVGFRTDDSSTVKYFMFAATPAQLTLMEIAA